MSDGAELVIAPVAPPEPLPMAAPSTEVAIAEPSVIVEAVPSVSAGEVAVVEAPPPSNTGLEPTLMSTIDAPPQVAVVDKPTTETLAVAEPVAAVAEVPAQPAFELIPADHKFNLPAELKSDDARMAEFVSILNEPIPAADRAQKLIDLHAKAMMEYAAWLAPETTKRQFAVFNQTKRDWEVRIMADPQLGGAGFEATKQAVARTRDKIISRSKIGSDQYKLHRTEYDDFIAVTGAGSHPVFWRLMHNASRFTDEAQIGEVPIAEIAPTKTNGAAPKGSIYRHPSSANMDK